MNEWLQALAAIAVFGLASMWLYAGLNKLSGRGGLEQRIRDAPGLIEDPWLVQGARILPHAEVAIAVAVIAAPVLGGICSVVALLIFAGLKPQIGADCGCFGPNTWRLLRNLNSALIHAALIAWSVAAVLLGSVVVLAADVRLGSAFLLLVLAIVMFAGGAHGRHRSRGTNRPDNPGGRGRRADTNLPATGGPDR